MGDAGVALQPRPDLGVLVGGVVVDHDVQPLAGVGLGDLLQEGEELLVAVAVGDLAGGDLEGGGAVADVVVGGPLGQAVPDGQDRLGPFQRLDL